MKNIFLWIFSHPVWTGIAGLCALITLLITLLGIDRRNANIEQVSGHISRGVQDKTNEVSNGIHGAYFPGRISSEAPSISKSPHVLAVFEEQDFELCGYQGFTATFARSNDENQEIVIRSMDRSLPNRTFQGYKKTAPTGEMIELWPSCNAKFELEKLSSSTRIVVSYWED